MLDLSDEEFEELVDRAWKRIPQQFLDALDNVVVVIQDEPDESAVGQSAEQPLLGLYSGIPVTERFEYSGVMPDEITIYQGSLQRICKTVEELAEQIYVTLIHEIGHYFGLGDERLQELNWG